jgi:glyoxylase-like metal-dependent hydrolase (beta-lactamase superfamily II)
VLRTVLAPNPSPLTLDGTRTYIVGKSSVAVIDPGPDDPEHLDAIADGIGDGVLQSVLLTHDHPDHGAGAHRLAERLGGRIRSLEDRSLQDGARIETDAGALVTVATPGHTADHVAFHWPERAAVFCGDLMMGGHDTALVAPPEGRLGPYLASLERIRSLEPDVIYPGHGPPFMHPDQAIGRYVRHRELRLEQVMKAIGAGAHDYDTLRVVVYGHDLDPGLERAAMAALKAYLEHLQGLGRVRRVRRGWAAV